jgi:pimeloyl-ACP methyl ester carboxylesterase
MARSGRQERNRTTRSFRQLRRFHHVINSDKVFGTHKPNWSDAQLAAIDTEVAATIPHAGLLILPNSSHFAFLQDPRQFNFAILHFLGDE